MKGIIFDFNGTLLWDSVLHYEAWKKYSKILRGTEFSDDEMRAHMFGHTNEDIIEYAIGSKPSKETTDKYAKEKESVYRAQCLQNSESFVLAPGVPELLDDLREKNIPMTIATMSDRENVAFFVKELHLEKWFDIDKIVYADGSFPGKPAPDIFLIASSRIGVVPADCVMVEDSLAGIVAAKAAGAGKIIAVASMEPVEFYKNIDGIYKVITNFSEIDRNLFNN